MFPKLIEFHIHKEKKQALLTISKNYFFDDIKVRIFFTITILLLSSLPLNCKHFI